jgi:hypothetical protein
MGMKKMSAQLEKIKNLRMLMSEITGPVQKEFFRADGVPGGIPRGALVELCGSRKTEWVIQFLCANESVQAFWLEKEQSILPTAIQQRGVNLERLTFGVVEELYPAVRRVIQSQLFEAVVVPSVFDELRVLKALQLLAEKANTTVFLLAKKPQAAFPISVQLDVKGKGSNLDIAVLKHKAAGLA